MYRHLSIVLCAAGLLLQPLNVAAEELSEKHRPLSLREAVEQALQENLNIKLQREDTGIAAGAVEIAQGRFDSQISASAGVQSEELTPLITIGGAEQEDSANLEAAYRKRFTTGTEFELGWNNTRFDSDAEQGLILNPSYTSTLSFGVTQPLWRGFGKNIQTGRLQAAEKSLQAATFDVDSLAADLAAQVKVGYWNLVFFLQDIEVKQLSLTLAEKLLEETETKIEAGKLAEVELYQPQSEVAKREEALIAAEKAIGVAEDELKLLLNSQDWLTPFTTTDTPDAAPIDVDQHVILARALDNRPDLKAANLNIDAARLGEMVAKDDLRPALDLVGKVGYGGTDDGYGDALNAATDDPNTRWQVGLNLTYPLENNIAKGNLRQARASHVKAKTSAQLLRLQITRSVRTTVRDVQLAIKAMDATRKTSVATEKRLEAEQAKFAAGRSTTLDVLIAQEAYAEALSQENQTRIQYVQSLAEIDRIQGLITFPAEN